MFKWYTVRTNDFFKWTFQRHVLKMRMDYVHNICSIVNNIEKTSLIVKEQRSHKLSLSLSLYMYSSRVKQRYDDDHLMIILNCLKMVLQFEIEQLKSMLMWWQSAMGTRVQLAMGVNIRAIKVLWHFPLGLIWRFKTLALFNRVLTKTLGKIKFWSYSRLLFCLDERSLSITCLCPLHVYFILLIYLDMDGLL